MSLRIQKKLLEFLFTTGEDGTGLLFLNWLCIRSIGTLDTAFLNRLYRPYFLKCLSDNKQLLLGADNVKVVKDTLSLMIWLKVRGVSFTHFNIPNFTNNQLISDYLKPLMEDKGSIVTTIGTNYWFYSLETINWNSVVTIISTSCPNLLIFGDKFEQIFKINKTTILEQVLPGDYFYFNDSVIKLLVKGGVCIKLQSINIDRCYKITINTILLIVHYCRDLITLSLDGCTKLNDSAINLLCLYLPKLQNLNINHIKNISNSAILIIGAKLTNIQSLKIHYCDNNALIRLGNNCKLLKSLSIQDGKSITNDGMLGFCEGCTLLSFELNNGLKITDRSVDYISHFWKNHLKALSLTRCNLITDDGIILYILETCKTMETFNLRLCSRLTSLIIMKMSIKKNLPSLRYFNFKYVIPNVIQIHYKEQFEILIQNENEYTTKLYVERFPNLKFTNF